MCISTRDAFLPSLRSYGDGRGDSIRKLLTSRKSLYYFCWLTPDFVYTYIYIYAAHLTNQPMPCVCMAAAVHMEPFPTSATGESNFNTNPCHVCCCSHGALLHFTVKRDNNPNCSTRLFFVNVFCKLGGVLCLRASLNNNGPTV